MSGINSSPVRLPRLLDGNLNEVTRLRPSQLSLKLSQMPLSTADGDFTGEEIPFHAWVELYTIHGTAGIYRVSTVENDYASDSQRVAFEHGLCILGDAIAQGDEEIDGSVQSVFSRLLAMQRAKTKDGRTLWAIGTCAAQSNVTIKPDGMTLLDAMLSALEQVPDYVIETDQTSIPWRINIVQRPQTVTAEGRLTRNLATAQVSLDDSDLCTRVYADALPGGYLDSAKTAQWGIVEKRLQLAEGTTADEAEAIAGRYLEKRDEPSISVSIDAVDLSRATGEALDAFTVGKRFRLALPAYGATVEEYITGISYGDVYGDPERVTLTLANTVADIAQRQRQAEKAASRTSYNFGSSLNSVRNTVTNNSYHLAAHERVLTGEGTTEDYTSYIDIRAQGVAIASQAQRIDGLSGEVQDMSAELVVQAGEISTKVSAGDIASTINQTAQSVLIQASKIALDGYVEGLLSDFGYISVDQLAVGDFGFTCNSYLTILEKNVEWKSAAVVTGCEHTSRKYHFQLTDGTSVYIDPLIDYSTQTLYYLGPV